ncbi:MAG: hypothetical protein NC240_07690 [Clostridium sp.]|nr:hypothetical protein [Clostridium sp.]
MKILKKVYEDIMSTIGNSYPERGGIIGEKDGIICEFYYDTKAECNNNTYIPNVKSLNRVLKEWYKHGVKFAGIIHSHPCCKKELSYADIEYGKRIMKMNDMKNILFPIVLIDKCVKVKLFQISIFGNVTELDFEMI